MKWLAYLLILAGVITMCYPKAISTYHAWQEQELLVKWEGGKAQQSMLQLNKTFEVLSQNEGSKNNRDRSGNILAILQIKKINLRLPIVEGASLEHLKIAGGHLKGTAPIGSVGNAAIAAHRSYTYGKQFNRLPEVGIGDEVLIETKSQIITYVVFNKTIINPDDLSILKSRDNKSIITLITCEPMKNPTKRLIIQAEKKKAQNKESLSF
ncbi:sortase A [Scopulibacillus darangshiensis]|uniref:Sortase A n=1 Tax=Scopulibacillus darangshiensis TaxID=442528 RepID=A0A4R2P7J3_9BACL|nr:class D sortase [Scopulibacillus darangshiensis]TCP30238.1 sortase A [Scopulibacillus darangshiensis]